ncbi:MAG: hypothetical protein BRD52_05670 [Bacteroidetes bacterium SW_4_67_19]|nr:MAG: hypothetical protein BRD52_05670 [Bacteroidetes bacterium SW_4_67_19]
MDEADQVETTKEKVSRLYARKYESAEDQSTASFEKVWDSETADEMPWNRLEDFDMKGFGKTNT